jgi:hypothetical protein
MPRRKPSYSFIFKGGEVIMHKKLYDSTGKVIKKISETLSESGSQLKFNRGKR